jgi:Ni,Fe-hydrogenase I large subunit
LVAYAAGVPRIQQLINTSLSKLGLGTPALFSTLGRVLARALETQAVAEQMAGWLNDLQNNMNAGNIAVANTTKWNPSTWPSTASGFGTTEAPRGALGHWVSIANEKITNYQIIIPSTWNGSPRDKSGNRGAWEQALLGTPVFDANRPIEILRTIHSYDPCMACAVHVIDPRGTEVTQVSVN